MATNVEDYRNLFFEESYEHLAEIEAGLLGLEDCPDNSDLLDQVFRGVHSIKGAAATFGVTSVADFSHSLENHLDKLRAGERKNDTGSAEAMLRSVDCLRELVEAARADETPGEELAKSIAEIKQALVNNALTEANAPATPVASNSDQATTQTWRIVFKPGPDAFQNGLDPTLIWRELSSFGELQVQFDGSHLPVLTALDPTKCYLAWEATLATDTPKEEFEQAFFFHADDADLSFELVGGATETVTPPESSEQGSAVEEVTAVDNPRSYTDWLVREGVVTASQLLKAMDLQFERRVPIGRLALRERVMTVEQVFETLEWSSIQGERFGETALSRGYLSAEKLGRILELQSEELPSVSELLVEMGVVSADVLRQEQEAYEKSLGKVPAKEALPLEAMDVTEEKPQPAVAKQVVATTTALAVDMHILKQNSELISDFLSDCREHLEDAEQHALLMETDTTSEEQLHALYRAFHTIKGVASFVGLTQITELAHAAEDVLNLAREGQLQLTGEPFELVLASLDSLRRLADEVPELLKLDQSPPADEKAIDLIVSLKGVAGSDQANAPAPPPVVVAQPTAPEAVAVEGSTESECQDANELSETKSEPVSEPTTVPAAQAAPTSKASTNKGKAAAPEMKETVRVDRSRLDQLVDMIGELVIGEAMVRQEVSERLSGVEVESLAQLGRVVRELQEMSLSLRMVPVAATFQKMHRIVRDVSHKLRKQVRFDVFGEDTELDKTMVDQLGDPLMHMVRNAVDHGIESPEERRAAGKSPEGRVTLKAYLQNGNFYVELSDDGKGLNRDKILSKAVEKGIVDASECEMMNDNDVWMLVFAPGFSTAQVVTDVSGRGVGMDVVKRAIESLNGSIEVDSVCGEGSTFRVRLPLTMAIVDGLTVSLADETFILPLVSVVESVRPQANEIKTVIGRGEIVQVRDETIPLVRLHRVFNRPARNLDPSKALVVILESDGRRFALLVDELLGQVQAVMKSLETNYEKVRGIAGATILGNGEVAFILDVQGIAKLHAKASYGRLPKNQAAIDTPPVESE